MKCQITKYRMEPGFDSTKRASNADAMSAWLRKATAFMLFTFANAYAWENRTLVAKGIVALDLSSGESATFRPGTRLETGADGTLTLIGTGGVTVVWTFKAQDRFVLEAPLQTIKNTTGNNVRVYVQVPEERQ